MFGFISDELRKTYRHPGRIWNVLRPGRLLAYARSLPARASLARLKARVGHRWREDGGTRRREYASYADYIAHQRAKLAFLDLSEYDAKFRETLRGRLAAAGIDWRGKNALCLAARIGTEVKAFQDMGAFCVGIDLNPGADNPLVLPGDFHAIQFPDGSADVVFTNSLDHAFDLPRVAGEIRRVLKPEGTLMVEAAAGITEGRNAGFYEAFYWRTVDDLVAVIERNGFNLRFRAAIDSPWKGTHLRFTKA
jgi:SAM-dependent methyltransferase